MSGAVGHTRPTLQTGTEYLTSTTGGAVYHPDRYGYYLHPSQHPRGVLDLNFGYSLKLVTQVLAF